ncbi:hypothetical protein HQ945_08610 [Phyllobacterium sp. BT25]|uniref:Uncharacterized protein n=1 Tax=Phyllobacterium pellucidum TaxID=2740464 RepID=A0A849VPF4_9HYPH|nr:hypothetical protein [Phyllobacterium pellucidum]NTS31316.1 hypothetical protein [Phyllobacterium pellucidum]
MIDLRHEPMSPTFDKWHVGGTPFPAVFHRFTEPDLGDPHDHPFAFRSIILHGGYIEEVYHPERGLIDVIARPPGDSFRIEATHIHRIVSLPGGECWTLMLPERQLRTSCFWQFRDDGAYFRKWHDEEWTPYDRETVDSGENPRG